MALSKKWPLHTHPNIYHFSDSPDDPDDYLAEVADSYKDQDFRPYYSSPYPDPSHLDIPPLDPEGTHP